MPFTHYPKLDSNTWCSVLWYGDGDRRNTLAAPLGVGESVAVYASAQNFTRFLGSVACDQPLEVTFAFSNEERVPVTAWTAVGGNPAVLIEQGGRYRQDQRPVLDSKLPADIREYYPADQLGLREITDEDLPDLHYDAVAQVMKYQPGGDGKYLVTIYGAWLRVQVTNKGDGAPTFLRLFCRGSVF
jgi:hypothetical protein